MLFGTLGRSERERNNDDIEMPILGALWSPLCYSHCLFEVTSMLSSKDALMPRRRHDCYPQVTPLELQVLKGGYEYKIFSSNYLWILCRKTCQGPPLCMRQYTTYRVDVLLVAESLLRSWIFL